MESEKKNDKFFSSTIITTLINNILSTHNLQDIRINHNFKHAYMHLIFQLSKCLCDFFHQKAIEINIKRITIEHWESFISKLDICYMFPILNPIKYKVSINEYVAYYEQYHNKTNKPNKNTLYIHNNIASVYNSMCGNIYSNKDIKIDEGIFIFMSYLILNTVLLLMENNIMIIDVANKKSLNISVFKCTLKSKFHDYGRDNIYDILDKKIDEYLLTFNV